MKHKRILIIGGSGFIGTHLAKRLLQLQTQVTIADKKKPCIKKTKYIYLNLNQDSDLKRIIKKRFDIIYQLAGVSGVAKVNSSNAFAINCIGSLNLLDSVVQHSPKSVIVFSNSRQEYGVPQYLPVDENHPQNPINQYGAQKLLITNLAQTYFKLHRLKTVVLRTSNVFGPTQNTHPNYNVVNLWINLAKQNKAITVFGKGQQIRDYLYISDLINAFVLAGTKNKAYGQIINIGSGKPLNMISMAKQIIKKHGGKIAYKSWPKNWQTAETGDYYTNTSKAKRILSWQPTISFTKALSLNL